MTKFTLVPEQPEHAETIEALVAEAFGPDRFHKTVYKLRDGVDPLGELGWVALDEGRQLQASIRYWPISIGNRWPAVLLGPVAVRPAVQGQGMGKALIRRTLALATSLGHRICVLVGDREYYEPFGFSNAAMLGLELPGWVDLDRFQVQALVPGALNGVSGMVGRPIAPTVVRLRA
ncbi:GNAT family N-acetyltransferase [Desertibaculum subflavum]|uniref:GNAT family N-acetyltransferase n=1 Tax=Desertibaculum subflavum TaxID=2268458 RepID=UPI000E671FC5